MRKNRQLDATAVSIALIQYKAVYTAKSLCLIFNKIYFSVFLFIDEKFILSATNFNFFIGIYFLFFRYAAAFFISFTLITC